LAWQEIHPPISPEFIADLADREKAQALADALIARKTYYVLSTM
jgi:hypothetical protein